MTTEEVIKRLRKWKPSKVEDLLIYCKLPLEYEGGGAFREVYRIIGTNLVIKVPTDNPKLITELECNRRHARKEYGVWQKIMRSKRKYVPIQPFMPAFHHFNHQTGVTLVERYEPLPKKDRTDKTYDEDITKLGTIASSLTGTADVDICPDKYDNIGLDADGMLKIIDLGCFENNLQ